MASIEHENELLLTHKSNIKVEWQEKIIFEFFFFNIWILNRKEICYLEQSTELEWAQWKVSEMQIVFCTI